MATKDYSSIYSIKDFAMKELAPKYFNMDVNKLNIGLIGYTTELIANTTEDTFNAVSTLVNEIYPNRAKMPETIYNNAALFQVDELFANPAYMTLMLFVNEDDIMKHGMRRESLIEFVLDSELIIDVEGKHFMMDYDVIITAKPFRGDLIYKAMYDLSFDNGVSDIKNPYVKTKRIKYGNTNYLGLLLKVRQVNKFTQLEQIINNDKINLPTLTFEFNDQLANFEVFYKAPNSKNYVQLKKRLANTTPIREPFCYYKFKNEKTVDITFTSRDNYFQPQFNSEILINIYTTLGSNGNFPLYQGDQVSVIPKSEKYIYNNNIVLFAVIQTESTEGRNRLSLEELNSIVSEKFSTSGAYNNENDLQTYFSNFKYKYGNEILFIKKRDDAFQRLFSAFALLKDKSNDIYPTNTLHTTINASDFDIEYETTNKYILKAGHLFRYKGASRDTAEIIPGMTLKDDLSVLNDEFVYTNPFLMTITKSPGIVGFYLNSFNSRNSLEYNYVNSDSMVQFICNNLYVSRNALLGEDEYKLTVFLTPTIDLDKPIIDPETKQDLGILVIKGFIEDESGAKICYCDFNFKAFDEKTGLYTYEAILKTDDYMTLSEKIRIFDLKDAISGGIENRLIPMVNCKINIYTFYKYDDINLSHEFDYLPELQPYSLTNIYSTVDERVNFMVPLNIIRSQMKYIKNDDGSYYIYLTFVPYVKAALMKDFNKYTEFMQNLFMQYNYMQGALDKITNNYSVDLKFYNTYGRSKNFVAGEENQLLDRVNCSIRFRVCPTVAVADQLALARDLRIFIKNYIETINDKGTNGIYISNLIQAIENSFEGVKYLKFVRINNYDSSVQIIENKSVDINLLTKEDRRNFVPEYLTISIDDIHIDLI